MDISDLPQSITAGCFRAVVEALQAHPHLQCVELWQVFDGSGSDDLVTLPSDKVWVRVQPLGGPEGWSTNNTVNADLVIVLDVNVPGTRAEDALNLWAAITGGARDPDGHAIPSALFPQSKALYGRLTDLGATCYMVSEGGVTPTVSEKGTQSLAVRGLVKIPIMAPVRI